MVIALQGIDRCDSVFPARFGGGDEPTFEIDLDKVDFTQGMNVTIVTSARSDAEGRALLKSFGMPFRN